MLNRRQLLCGLCGTSGLAVAGCLETVQPTRNEPVTTVAGSGMTLSSEGFADGERIPDQYTYEGADVSPPLSIGGVPDEAASLVLIVDDPDAPTPPFTHWVLWNLPPDTTSLPEGMPRTARLEAYGGAKQGNNSFGELGYLGPRPPEGDGRHTYRFTLYAVETELNVQARSRRGRVDDAMRGQVVATARLTGTYER